MSSRLEPERRTGAVVTGPPGEESDPAGALVCHVTGRAGKFSEVWIDAQVEAVDRYRSSLLSIREPAQTYYWQSKPVALARSGALIRGINRLSKRPVEVGTAIIPDLARSVLARAESTRGRDIAVFHAHFGYVGYLWTGVAKKARIPLITSFYGVDAAAQRFSTPAWRRRYGQLFSVTRGVLVEGPNMARRLASLGCPEEKIHIVRLPFAPPTLKLQSDDLEREFAVGLGGRFVQKKGFDVALRAFAAAFPDGPERLVFAGGGPEGDSLRALARELGIADRVLFHLPLPLGDFAALLKRCHITLFPSLTASNGDAEGGAPMSIPLAQALGVPIIVSDHDDLPWAAAPGTPTVRSGDAEELAAVLAEVYRASVERTPELLEHLAAARAFVEEAHNPTRLTSEREAVYDLALS